MLINEMVKYHGAKVHFGIYFFSLLWKNNSWKLGQIKLKYTALVTKIMSEGIYGIKTIHAK